MEKIAVIKTGGKQYLVKEGNKVKLEKLNAKEGEEIFANGEFISGRKFSLGKILLVADDKGVKIGNPFVNDAEVTAKILKQGRNKKVIIFRYHSKTRYKKKAGHRQHFTEVEIIEIR